MAAANPLGKVPTLVLKDGTALYDSRVICEYLDAVAGGNVSTPFSGSFYGLVLDARCTLAVSA